MPQDALDAALSTVPHWYRSDFGPNSVEVHVGDRHEVRFSHRPPTPDLQQVRRFIERSGGAWLQNATGSHELHAEAVQEAVVLHWLSVRAPAVDWMRLLDFTRRIHSHTYEGAPVTLNLVIGKGSGTADVTDPSHEKLLAPLASSLQVFLRLDPQLRVVDYAEIPWGAIEDTKDYKFHPEFLHPFVSQLGPNEVSVHLTAASDIVILNNEGLLAARRRARWFIYDVHTFKNSLVDIVGEYRLGCNLFELLFDLSYRRRGALLIYDPNGTVYDHVVNPESFITGRNSKVQPGSLLERVAEVVYQIQLNKVDFSARRKRLLMEVASLDGAVIFNSVGVFAIGALIEPHSSVEGQSGARSTAAASSFYWGGIPFKISTDGDVTIFFKSKGEQGESEGKLLFR